MIDFDIDDFLVKMFENVPTGWKLEFPGVQAKRGNYLQFSGLEESYTDNDSSAPIGSGAVDVLLEGAEVSFSGAFSTAPNKSLSVRRKEAVDWALLAASLFQKSIPTCNFWVNNIIIQESEGSQASHRYAIEIGVTFSEIN